MTLYFIQPPRCNRTPSSLFGVGAKDPQSDIDTHHEKAARHFRARKTADTEAPCQVPDLDAP